MQSSKKLKSYNIKDGLVLSKEKPQRVFACIILSASYDWCSLSHCSSSALPSRLGNGNCYYAHLNLRASPCVKANIVNSNTSCVRTS